MSDTSYIRKEISVSDFEDVVINSATHKVYRLNASSVHSSYIPRTTDIITVSPSSAGANIRCWVKFATNEWHIHISDLSYVGKLYYRLKSRSY